MSRRRHPRGFVVATVFAFVVLASALPGAAGSAPTDQITITMLGFSGAQPAWQVLIPNFERVYPNITIDPTYVQSATGTMLEQIELQTGSAPDLLTVIPGCLGPATLCTLAQPGDLAPLVHVPWAKRSLPSVTSLSKYGKGLYVFEPQVTPYGVFTNNALFAKLGLKVPQTFAQLLDVCRKSKAAGIPALILDGGTSDTGVFLRNLAIATVYAQDKHWTAQLKAGTVTFSGTPGWRQAFQEFADMNSAGCFQPGVSATSGGGQEQEFAQGQGLMMWQFSGVKGAVDSYDPQFAYSFAPAPFGASPNQTATFLHNNSGLSINAHSSPQNRAAALLFINFIARPKQNALFTQITGGLTQYQFLKGQIPTFMSAFTPVFAQNRFIVDPFAALGNGQVGLTEIQQAQGLLTGQTTVDGAVSAMDAAWKQGPN